MEISRLLMAISRKNHKPRVKLAQTSLITMLLPNNPRGLLGNVAFMCLSRSIKPALRLMFFVLQDL